MRFINAAPGAPGAIGPYSQAVAAGGFVFISGQIPLDPGTGKLVEGGVDAQMEQVMRNLQAVLEGCSLSFAAVVKATIFLVDLADFEVVNEIYARWLADARPARSTVQVSALPRSAQVEVEMIACQTSS